MEPIAIIGMGCRFPGAPNLEAFWQLLRSGVNAVREVPPGRWDADALFDARKTARGKMNTRWGGFLEDIEHFDAAFFKITPAEAATLDPQQRLLLETAWEAFENAGQVAERLSGGRAGVFVGIGPGDYGRLALKDLSLIEPHTNTGNFLSIAANRISYFFDLHGPSMAVDTACSSSLVAVHLACQSISNDECDLALAGGVNVLCSPELTVGLSKSGAMSPDGSCKAFDARANGYVRGEGVGLVVLKPLAKALADDDSVYAVIRGSAVNQNGRTNGLTAPNRRGQEAVLREACRRAGVSPAQVQYVEAHGSGTLLGDLIEAEALGAVYGAARSNEDRCLIGSVKTNIGHLETAAGIAGLIKVALSLRHREIPASLHFQEPNPHIHFDEDRLRVQTTLSEWPADPGLAVAGVSAFAFGGTNAHIIVEERPRRAAREQNHAGAAADAQAYLLPLSARTADAVHTLARDFLHFLTADGPGVSTSLYDLCFTASVKRSQHDYRLSFVFRTLDELIRQLEAYLNGRLLDSVAAGRKHPTRARKVAFLFSGQVGGARRLGRQWQYVASFWPKAKECDALFQQHTGRSVAETFAGSESNHGPDESSMNGPLLFSLQVATAELWRSWGATPGAVVGYSTGEIAAMHFTGRLSLPDAVQLVALGERMSRDVLARVDEPQAHAGGVQLFSPTLRVEENGQSHRVREVDDPAFLQSAVCSLVECGYDTFVEVGPTPVLGAILPNLFGSDERVMLISQPTGKVPGATLLEPLGKLFTLGWEIDWPQLFPRGGCLVELPSYPWQRERHWLKSSAASAPPQ